MEHDYTTWGREQLLTHVEMLEETCDAGTRERAALVELLAAINQLASSGHKYIRRILPLIPADDIEYAQMIELLMNTIKVSSGLIITDGSI